MSAERPLAFVAGWAQSERSLKAVAGAIGGSRETVFIAASELSSKRSAAAGLIAQLEKLAAPVQLVAWSMGGMLALEVCAARPDLLERLVLISSTPRFCEGAGFSFGCPVTALEAMQQNLQQFPQQTLTEFFTAFYSPVRADAGLIQRKVEDALRFEMQALLSGLDYLRQMDLRECLSCIAIPVLALHGKDDLIISARCSEYLAKKLPAGKSIVVPDAGHALAENIPPGLIAELQMFLA